MEILKMSADAFVKMHEEAVNSKNTKKVDKDLFYAIKEALEFISDVHWANETTFEDGTQVLVTSYVMSTKKPVQCIYCTNSPLVGMDAN